MKDIHSEDGILTLPEVTPRPKRKRSRRQRKIWKPDRPSKSLGSLRKIALGHRWPAMFSFNPPATTAALSNEFQLFLNKLFRRELKGNQIGFLLVREFKPIPAVPERSHFHVLVTQPLPESLVKRFEKRFLKRCGLKGNRSRAFDYAFHILEGEPTFGNYVCKFKKDGVDVTSTPKDWDYKNILKPFHFGYLPKLKAVRTPTLLTN